MILDTLRDFLGQAPVGFEWVEYVVAACIFLILFSFVTTWFKDFARYLGGRR